MDFADVDEDAALAKAYEESLKHFNEVELPMRKQNGEPSSEIVIDITEDSVRPGCSTVQEIAKQPSPVYNALQPLYSGKEAEGFDMSNATEWIYPTNYPIRKYQKNIVENALFKNTLVCLPTGLGKTFIAAVVMYNYYRWYPKNKIVFMAHSKPLVAQQVEACCKVMGISPLVTAELTGNMPQSNRKIQWETKRIFFLTPQVFNNDLAKDIVKPDSIRCLVIDEAHKALGNQAYVQVIRSIKAFNDKFRVLALSATPGDDMNLVKDVIQNLMISHLEVRNEEDPDVKPYLHEKKIDTITVPLDAKILEIKDQFLGVIDKYVRPLVQHKLIPQSYSGFGSYMMIMKQKQFMQDPGGPPEMRGMFASNFSVAISLLRANEELVTHGMRTFLNKLLNIQSGEGATNKVHCRVANDEAFKSVISNLESYLGPDKDVSFDPDTSLVRLLDEVDSLAPTHPVVYSHPKFLVLEEVITKHFDNFEGSTRVIVFCKSRPCTGEICNFLSRFRPLVKPMIFIGQSQTNVGKTTKGFTQKNQLAVMKKFREGIYNTLVATCVAEEGLDIGEVDLIINFDSSKTSSTQVQRSGRTGRKRDGRVVNLVTEGKELKDYNTSVSKAKTMSKALVNGVKKLPFYHNNPKLLPTNVNPVCQELFLTVTKTITPERDPKRKKGSKPGKTESDGSDNKKKKKEMKKKEKEIDKNENEVRFEGTTSQTKVNKYDIRYAMEKAREKNKNNEISHNDSSGSLFETIGTIELMRNSRKNKAKLPNKKTVKNKNNIFSKILNSGTRQEEVEIIELEDSIKFDIPLYNDDIKDAVSQENESNFNFLANDDKEIILKFLKDNQSSRKTKHEIRKFLDLELICRYVPCEVDEFDPFPELEKIAHQHLDVDDLKLSQDSDIIRVIQRVFVAQKSPTRFEDCVVDEPLEKLSNADKAKVIDAFNMDDFLSPIDALNSLDRFSAIVSSTPKKIDERSENIYGFKEGGTIEISSTDNNKPSAETNYAVADFDLWNGDDFFEIPEKLSEMIPVPKPRADADNKQRKVDVSMITVTQALDIVENYETEQDEDNTTSPIFCTQRRKITPVKSTNEDRKSLFSSSPILSQKNRKKSRKSIQFSGNASTSKEKNIEPSLSVEVTHTNGGSDDDLFAEAEAEWKNICEQIATQKPPSPITASPNMNETIVYEVDETEIDASIILKKTAVTDDSVKMVAMTSADHSVQIAPIQPAKPPPKTAVVRPFGFEEKNLDSWLDDSVWLTNSPPAKRNKLLFGKSQVKSSTRSAGLSQAKEKPTFSSNFDCMPDEWLEVEEPKKKVDCYLLSDDSDDVFAGFVRPRKRKKVSKVNESDGSTKPAENFTDSSKVATINDDDDLSDGALAAIRAVEEYEKNMPKKPETSSACKSNSKLMKGVDFILWDSDDDNDDLFQPVKNALSNKTASQKQNDAAFEKSTLTTVAEIQPVRRSDSSMENWKHKKRKRGKPCQGRPKKCEFIEVEADLSNHSNISSDEENTSGLDEYDSSFVVENDVLTQVPNVDMTAKYLQSTKSPLVGAVGGFKIPREKKPVDFNIFSQFDPETDKDYEHDSFCVDAPDDDEEEHEMSALELAELILENQKRKKKRKRKELEDSEVKKKPKHRRIITIASESSDDDLLPSKSSSKPSTSKCNATVHLEKSRNVENPRGNASNSASNNKKKDQRTTSASTHQIADDKPSIFIGSRQIASAPEITTSLRARWNIRVHVRSLPGADFIVSWRIGINRIVLSDFANGGPTSKNSLKDSTQRLRTYFSKPVFIIEDDKIKGLPLTVGCHKTLWAKHSYETLSKLCEADVQIIFSKSKEDTARLVALFAKQESIQGHGIIIQGPELFPHTEKKVRFYSSLPGVNIANALRISYKFSSIASFINSCDSVACIHDYFGVDRETAHKIYQSLFIVPVS